MARTYASSRDAHHFVSETPHFQELMVDEKSHGLGTPKTYFFPRQDMTHSDDFGFRSPRHVQEKICTCAASIVSRIRGGCFGDGCITARTKVYDEINELENLFVARCLFLQYCLL